MGQITRQAYQTRIDRLMEVYADISRRANEVSASRCPYKDRLDQCTAQFSCRNKQRAAVVRGAPMCVGDGRIEYTKAWENS